MVFRIPGIAVFGRFATATFSMLLLAAGLCQAGPQQEAPADSGDELRTSLALSSALQTSSDLDGDGEVRALRSLVKFDLNKRLASSLKSALSLQYRHSRFHFDHTTPFGGTEPWGTIHEAGIGALFDWQIEKTWSLKALSSLEFSGEEGAVLEDTVSVGLGAALSKQFSRKFSLGFGFAATSGLEEEKVIPMLIIFWQISENWRLANPFRPGPTSPAGLELSHYFSKKLEAGVGTTYRSQRFRLDERGTAADGIGESTDFLSYLRLSGNITPATAIDLYAGFVWDGKLTLENEDGQELYEVGYKPAPILALTLKHRF
ncbi:MAG TPA: DUF6268 family outer membrane beta-barrel protein [Desulfuromonadales bacterium]|nr:DUF6268 family outer membrane beta-barrel protein [Desulfuromonadales bacterium]